MFHPIKFQIRTSFMASIQKSFEQNLIKKRLLTIPIIRKKVSLPRVYFPTDLMNITSEFLLLIYFSEI